MAKTPVEEADELLQEQLQRVAKFRGIGIDELDAEALARANVPFATVLALIRKGCPMKLVAAILA